MDPTRPLPAAARDTILRAKGGDLDAFEDLLVCYERQIFSYILRLVRQREDAEDLTQTTFLKFYQSLPTIDAEKNVRAWVYRIATNVVRDWWRKRKHQPEWRDPEDDVFEAAGTNTRGVTYEYIETKMDLDAALAQLTPSHRAVLLLVYRDGLSYQEIAEALSTPINTVKTRLFRAKRALQLHLNDSYG